MVVDGVVGGYELGVASRVCLERCLAELRFGGLLSSRFRSE